MVHVHPKAYQTEAWYYATQHRLYVSQKPTDRLYVCMFAADGATVFSGLWPRESESLRLPDLPSGMYVATFEGGQDHTPAPVRFVVP